MKGLLIGTLIILAGYGTQPQASRSELVACIVTEKVNPVTPEFALSCECHTRWTVECETRNPACADSDTRKSCDKRVFYITNRQWPPSWKDGEYLGARLLARREGQTLTAVNTYPLPLKTSLHPTN